VAKLLGTGTQQADVLPGEVDLAGPKPWRARMGERRWWLLSALPKVQGSPQGLLRDCRRWVRAAASVGGAVSTSQVSG